MQLTIYGARGSHPIARRNNIRYGGNSTCLYLRTDAGAHYIMDGGTGIVNLGLDLLKREFKQGTGEATILVGHTHWDHIMGYPFFHPFYMAGNRFRVVSAGQTGVSIRDILSGQHHDLHFPVPFEDLAAEIDYCDVTIGEKLLFGDVTISTFQTNHPGLTVAYRIEADGGAIVIITDTARIHAVRLGDNMGGPDPDAAFTARYTEQLTAFVENADVLVHDAHFFDHEIRDKEHWGHATGEDALILARRASVKKLVLFHHAPEHSDGEVDQILQNTKDLARKDTLEIVAASEGCTLEVRGPTP